MVAVARGSNGPTQQLAHQRTLAQQPQQAQPQVSPRVRSNMAFTSSFFHSHSNVGPQAQHPAAAASPHGAAGHASAAMWRHQCSAGADDESVGRLRARARSMDVSSRVILSLQQQRALGASNIRRTSLAKGEEGVVEADSQQRGGLEGVAEVDSQQGALAPLQLLPSTTFCRRTTSLLATLMAPGSHQLKLQSNQEQRGGRHNSNGTMWAMDMMVGVGMCACRGGGGQW